MNIVYDIITILMENDYYGVSPEIERVKGKYKIKKSFKDFLYQKKRDILFFLKN